MIKDVLAIITAKITNKILRFFDFGGGTSLPGVLALKISPNILRTLVNQTKKEIISVTGTNGKTTTCGFIASILRADGRKITHNKKGANMLTGVTTAVINSSSVLGKMEVDNSLLESDEAYLPKFADYFSADFLVVTNLFRDQLDRYGELEHTAHKIMEAIDKFNKNPKFKTVLNGDDPSVANLSDEKTVFFGFEDIEFCNIDKNVETSSESANCPCKKELKYSKKFYGHIGHYYCDCGYSRPTPKYKAFGKVFVDYSIITIETETEKFEVRVNMPGLYNTYNALAAITLGLELGIDSEKIQKAFETYETIFGRAEILKLRGKDTIIQLIKNPAGATEVLRTVKDDQNSRLLIIINDDYADGRDVSWLWDANFELLTNHKKQIITSGIRGADMAVRLKYAGIPQENIKTEKDIKTAIIKSLRQTENGEKLYILPTYTALLNIQKTIAHLKTK